MSDYFWVDADGGVPTFGPFDTERDAEIARKALAQCCDWLIWAVKTTFVNEPL